MSARAAFDPAANPLQLSSHLRSLLASAVQERTHNGPPPAPSHALELGQHGPLTADETDMAGLHPKQESSSHGSGACRDKTPTVKIPGYTVFDVVGHGGAGVVYRAQRKADGLVTAVKVLRTELCFDSLMLNRFEREIQAISMLEHPNIVKVFEVGRSEDGRPFYSMEFLKGLTLREHIQAPPRLTIHQAVALFSEVGYAISYAHQAGIVHRDLKSSNIIVNPHQEGETRVKLVDFGVAKFLEPQAAHRGLTRQGVVLGSTTAMSPEQIRGQPIDRRADIYALGVLLFELLTGELPFVSHDQRDLLRMHLGGPVPLPSHRHRPVYAFDAIVQRALQKRREDRFDSAREMVDATQLALQRPGLRPRTPTTSVSAIGLCARLEAKSDIFESRTAIKALTRIQDAISQCFRDANLLRPINTMHAQLGLALLVETGAAKLARLEEIEQLMRKLLDRFEEMNSQTQGVQVRLTLHIDDAEISPDDDRFVSGPILAYEDWSMTVAEAPQEQSRITPLFERTRAQLLARARSITAS